MAITFACACGKMLRIADEHAGRFVKCPVCSATQKAAPPATDEFEDFELVEDEPSAAPTKESRSSGEAAAAQPAGGNLKKKKKKKKKPAATEDDWYEKAKEREEWLKRVVRGGAYVLFGALMVIGCAIMYLFYWEDVKFVGGKAVLGCVVFAVMGLAAIGKGVIGLALGQFLGDEE